LCRSYAPAIIKELARIAKHGERERDRVAASEVLLDRGLGKALQTIEVTPLDQAERIRELEALLVGAALELPAGVLELPSDTSTSKQAEAGQE